MGDYSKVTSYCDDLVRVLKGNHDSDSFTNSFHGLNSLRSSSDSDFASIQASLRDYESKIDCCKSKTEAAKSGVVSNEELELLRKELEEELAKETLLSEELRDIDDLARTRNSIQEHERALKKLEQDGIGAQRTLSMLASVTNIIPNPSNVSGNIIDRDKGVVQKFEFDSTRMTDFDMCNNIWKMIGL